MPCYTISTVKVDAGTMILAEVETAFRAMGLTTWTTGSRITHSAGSYDQSTGVATWKGQDRTQELKREYSRAVMFSQAKRHGWTVKSDAKNPNKYQLIKR